MISEICSISPCPKPSRADVGLARGAIARHRDVVIGVKARLSNSIADTNDLEGLRRAQEAAAPFKLR
jgi:dihydroorotase